LLTEEEEKNNMRKANIGPDWRLQGCMTHGAEADQHTLYLCRYRMCKDMWHKPIYCNKCAEDEGTHMHKFHYPADDIGVQAYLRDRLNPENEEQYEEMS